jgi:response regulator receiver domain-containing protein
MQRKVVYGFSSIFFGLPLDNKDIGLAELQACKKVLNMMLMTSVIATETEGRNGAMWEWDTLQIIFMLPLVIIWITISQIFSYLMMNLKLCQSLRQHWEDKKYTVFGFTEPLIALEDFRINYTKYDLVICDLRMPSLNGFEFIKNIRQIKSEIKVLLMTASAVEDDSK